MAKESPRQDIEADELRLAKALELANRSNNSKWRPIWQGVLWGIGSTIGLAIAFYILSLIIKPLQYVPILGTFIREQIQPVIDQNVAVPTNIDTTMPSTTPSVTPSTPSSTPASTSTSKSSISNNYLSIILPGNWNVKLNQTSTGNKLLNFQATADQNVTFQIEITKQPVSTTEQTLLATDNVTVDGVVGSQLRFKTKTGEALNIQLAKSDLFYAIRLDYNPDTFNGRQTFAQILDSFKFRN